jgi:hypothetical protein
MKNNKVRERYLWIKYKITQAVYDKMLAFGKGGCWICKRKPKPGKTLNIDHDHKTMQVRGLLCFFCNKFMVGRRRREHAHLFDTTAAYLRSTKDWRDEVGEKKGEHAVQELRRQTKKRS